MEFCPHCGNHMKGYRICPKCGPAKYWWINYPEIVEELNVEEQHVIRKDDGELAPYNWVKDAWNGDGKYHPLYWIKSTHDGRYYPWNWYWNSNDGIYRPRGY